MTSRLNEAGRLSKPASNVSLPTEEQLAHFRAIGLTWISFGATPT